jgi:hypothetical protein
MPRLAQYDGERLAATIAKQHGVIDRRQAVACAMTAPALRYRVRPGGPWQAVLPGVYREGRGVLTDKQRAVAAFIYARRAIAITGTAAIAWHGLPVKRSEFIDVLVPLQYKRCDAGFVRLHRTSLELVVICEDGPSSTRRWIARSLTRPGSRPT